jgi:hypothetical protein
MSRRVTLKTEQKRSPANIFTAGEDIPVDTLVYISDANTVSIVSWNTGFNKVVGISNTAVTDGNEILITILGLHVLETSLAGGTAGDPVYFDNDGALTLTEPTSGSADFIQQVGIYNTPTSIFIQLLPPIKF